MHTTARPTTMPTAFGAAYGLSTSEYFRRIGLVLRATDEDVFGRPADAHARWVVDHSTYIEDYKAAMRKIMTMNTGRKCGKTRLSQALFEWELKRPQRNRAKLRASRAVKPKKYRHILRRTA